ncbi:uncharacterized protein LOC107695764 [Tachysurus ichikawai]
MERPRVKALRLQCSRSFFLTKKKPGLRTICALGNKSSAEVRADLSQADELNTFYGHFESNLSSASLPISASGSSSQSSDNQVIAMSEDEVWRALKRVNIRKAAGPDGISGRILRSCIDQLAGLFTSIFNESLATSVVPTSFKKSVIIPVPKNNKPSCLNDYRPVALTSVVMKVFDGLVKNVICFSDTLDPLQFAYRSNRSTDDAISHILHSSLTHIDNNNRNYVRLLFIDYSSAFNTIVPIKLASKLMDLGLNSSLCNWILDFLTGRPQVVKVGQYTPNSITLNIGAPQGCVLSPCSTLSTHMTAKRQQQPYTPLMISGTPVERVSSFKYLGVNISEDLTWTNHIQTQLQFRLQDIYLKRCKNRAVKIIKDSIHPSNHHSTLLPSGKRFRSLMAKTERLSWSFFPQAIRLLNS